MDMILLDSVIGLSVPRSGDYNNYLNTVETLRAGLHRLAREVQRQEVLTQEENEGRELMLSFGAGPGMDAEWITLAACYFHWYGVSIINYARLIGFINGLDSGAINKSMIQDKQYYKSIKDACIKYTQSVPEIADIKKWRDKVGGHFALTSPESRDSAATLEASVIAPVTYSAGRYKIHQLKWCTANSTGQSQTPEIPEWSVTETHEKLANRFWPDFAYSDAGALVC